MRSCSSVCGSIHPPIHPPSQKSFVCWRAGTHRITLMPHDANRQVLADLPHPPSHLQYTLPTTSEYKSPTLRAYIDAECGSLDALYLEILGDFFRNAFDGSAVGNFSNRGSCVQGLFTRA